MPWQLARHGKLAAGILTIVAIACVVVPLDTPELAPWPATLRAPFMERIALAQLMLGAASILAVAVVLFLSIAPSQHVEFNFTQLEIGGTVWLTMQVRCAGPMIEHLKLDVWLDESMSPTELVGPPHSSWRPFSIKFGPVDTLYGWQTSLDRVYPRAMAAYLNIQLPAERKQPKLLVQWWGDRSGPNAVELRPDDDERGVWTRGLPTKVKMPFDWAA